MGSDDSDGRDREKPKAQQKGWDWMFLTGEEITRIMKEAPLRIKLIIVARKVWILWVRVFLRPFPEKLKLKIYEKAWLATGKIRDRMHDSLTDWMYSVGFWGPIE